MKIEVNEERLRLILTQSLCRSCPLELNLEKCKDECKKSSCFNIKLKYLQDNIDTNMLDIKYRIKEADTSKNQKTINNIQNAVKMIEDYVIEEETSTQRAIRYETLLAFFKDIRRLVK